MDDRKQTESVSKPLVRAISDKFDLLLHGHADTVKDLDFYGRDFGMERLGFLLVPYILRKKIRNLINLRLQMECGPFPPRKDGGYGWFLVEETIDENELRAEYNAGVNVAGNNIGSMNEQFSGIYYYWITKYFDNEGNLNRGIRWLCENDIPQNNINGTVRKAQLSEEDAAQLIQSNLLVKKGEEYQLNFPCFSEIQFEKFISQLDIEDEKLDDLLVEWILAVRKSFDQFVPQRLNDQINQWVSGYVYQMIGYVIDELIQRGTLRKPDSEKPLTDGIFYVAGKLIHP